MLAQTLRDVLMREAELFDELSQTAGLLDGIQVGALKVFDQAEHQLFVAARVAAHDRRYSIKACDTCRAPAPLARDQLVAVREPSHQQRLKYSMQPDRLGELTQGLGVETRTDLLT